MISVRDVSITYKTTFEKAPPSFRKSVVRMGRGSRNIRLVEAVRNVSFEVYPGQTLGLIGRNGAGKSTLVRAIAGILPPTKGEIETRGRMGTLLALGVGFNREISGRDNVILGGLANGYTRDEIEAKYQEIADWSELGDFLEMPMRTYSSGMFGRLAFSVAVHLDPDILLVDEALSAGDAAFREKAQAKMENVAKNAGAMVLVSHGLGIVREMCDYVVWLEQGEVMMAGDPTDVIIAYEENQGVTETTITREDI